MHWRLSPSWFSSSAGCSELQGDSLTLGMWILNHIYNQQLIHIKAVAVALFMQLTQSMVSSTIFMPLQTHVFYHRHHGPTQL
jgi:hypothetical protein